MKLSNLYLFLFLFSLISCSAPQKNSFISVKGSQLMLKDHPYRFVGFNMWYACYLGASEQGRQRLIKELDTLKSLGCSNLRILGASEKNVMPRSLPWAIQTSPGVYDEGLLKGLDFVLAEMGKRGMYAVIYLNNYWQWSGGMSQYVNWHSKDSVPDPDATGGGGRFMHYSAQFYSEPQAVIMNRTYIRMLLNRENTYSGIKYKNDPSVMAWELANEPRPGTDDANGESNMPAFLKWIDETASFIHSIDHNHLVTTGSEGTVGCLQNDDYFIKVHNSKAIDFINFHLWARNWSWFDPKRINETLPVSQQKAKDYILLHISLARKLRKPITMEEFGLDRDSAATQPGTPVSARDIYFKNIFSLVTDSILNNSPLAGCNIWAWGGVGFPASYDNIMTNASAFLGDPLDEPQGLNSVYISDSSTLLIIKASAGRVISNMK
jgi:mannan endo-1,4-beta-mannosidase